MSNELRMPLAGWLCKMSEARVPYQARGLAVYAVLFKVTDNEELAKLVGMDTVGRADKTYNKWKKHLSDNGWVRISAETVGRKTTITVTPSVDTIPVTFTDVHPRDPRKFYASNNYAADVESTGENYASNVEVTHEPRKSYASSVESTHETGQPSRARIENPSGLLSSQEDKNKPPFIPPLAEKDDLSAQPDDYERVKYKNGKLLIANGFRSFWLEQFDGDAKRLDLALTQAAGYVEPNGHRPLEAQVSAQLARIAAEKHDRDQRYANAAKSNTSPGKKSAEQQRREADLL